jgi:hypothetical protein
MKGRKNNMTFQLGHPQFNTGRTHFKKGMTPWLKGTKGLMKPNSGSFKKGHNAGINHPRYKGGLCFDKQKKRWLITCRDGSFQIYARAVFESFIKRELMGFEIIHHINEDSTDDRKENLKLTTRGEHVKIHKPREAKK